MKSQFEGKNRGWICGGGGGGGGCISNLMACLIWWKSICTWPNKYFPTKNKSIAFISFYIFIFPSLWSLLHVGSLMTSIVLGFIFPSTSVRWISRGILISQKKSWPIKSKHCYNVIVPHVYHAYYQIKPFKNIILKVFSEKPIFVYIYIFFFSYNQVFMKMCEYFSLAFKFGFIFFKKKFRLVRLYEVFRTIDDIIIRKKIIKQL